MCHLFQGALPYPSSLGYFPLVCINCQTYSCFTFYLFFHRGSFSVNTNLNDLARIIELASDKAKAWIQDSWLEPQLPPLLPCSQLYPVPPPLWNAEAQLLQKETLCVFLGEVHCLPMTHEFIRLTHPDCCSFPALPASLHGLLGAVVLVCTTPVFCIFFLAPTKIRYHFNLVKSPSRTHHSKRDFSLPLRLNNCHCWKELSPHLSPPPPTWKTHMFIHDYAQPHGP